MDWGSSRIIMIITIRLSNPLRLTIDNWPRPKHSHSTWPIRNTESNFKRTKKQRLHYKIRIKWWQLILPFGKNRIMVSHHNNWQIQIRHNTFPKTDLLSTAINTFTYEIIDIRYQIYSASSAQVSFEKQLRIV